MKIENYFKEDQYYQHYGIIILMSSTYIFYIII